MARRERFETLLRFGDFSAIRRCSRGCIRTAMFFIRCEPLARCRYLLRDGSLEEIFARGKKIMEDIPPCQGICYLFGNVRRIIT